MYFPDYQKKKKNVHYLGKDFNSLGIIPILLLTKFQYKNRIIRKLVDSTLLLIFNFNCCERDRLVCDYVGYLVANVENLPCDRLVILQKVKPQVELIINNDSIYSPKKVK
jgi:hypothetical protein